MWQLLLQLRALLPYLTRLLPLLEGAIARTGGSRAEISLDTSHFDRAIGEIQTSDEAIRQQLQSQAALLSRIHSQLGFVSSAIERLAARQTEIEETLQARMRILVYLTGAAMVLLVFVTGATIYLLINLRP